MVLPEETDSEVDKRPDERDYRSWRKDCPARAAKLSVGRSLQV